MNTRDIILLAAKRLYMENGFSDTTNTMIAKEAGVNLGLITYYFKTKDVIASDMLNYNYETLFSHVLNHLKTEDELLQIVTFFKLHFKLTEIDPDYDRFIYEMNKLDLLEKATRDGNLYNLYRTIVDKNPLIDSSDKERICDIGVAITFGVMRELTMKQFQKDIIMSKEELYDRCMTQMFYALHIETNPLVLRTLFNASGSSVELLLEEHPHLKEVKNYLYKN
ncbi:TetR/AcrR family transcriptional regulator [Alkalibacter rhizosphaerae]|uniref:TetR/AcrR family transcriptional regulator n=1 Tax=Alkalibacter rhizosphaerae TaxID=2815577 RepID=A0A975AIR2_9FIRM|nr:TetR/AcrR family transcriptional regulator [Alkalibacter rhizosphaerae]QSX08800.1 TetR/AcrR family transcriptional regulator [Alkalibacter rhizosphaerae]